MSITEEIRAQVGSDDALASAWRLDDLAAALDHSVVRVMVDSIRPAEREQAEQIATARGYSMSVDAGADPGWLSVTFTRSC